VPEGHTGLVVVNINPLYTARELAEQLADCRLAAVLVRKIFRRRLRDELRGARG